jgi:3-methyl-2-oxobutanoate hydroxymethyltransferase
MNSRVSVNDLQLLKSRGEKWPMITAYDAITARLFEQAGVPVLLVGDSASMVMLGHDSTLPITLEELITFTASVVRTTERAMVIADLPFGSYQVSPRQALASATRMIKESGAQAVKLEGGDVVLGQVEAIVSSGIPVMGHLGLTPQSVHALGGYKVQGRGEKGDILLRDAKALEAAGAFAIVLEAIPADLAGQVTAAVSVPVIGIGAGASVDAQVIVWQDLVGLSEPPHPRFVKQYANVRGVISDAVAAWVSDIATGAYPAEEHTYK